LAHYNLEGINNCLPPHTVVKIKKRNIGIME